MDQSLHLSLNFLFFDTHFLLVLLNHSIDIEALCTGVIRRRLLIVLFVLCGNDTLDSCVHAGKLLCACNLVGHVDRLVKDRTLVMALLDQ